MKPCPLTAREVEATYGRHCAVCGRGSGEHPSRGTPLAIVIVPSATSAAVDVDGPTVPVALPRNAARGDS